MTGEEVSPVLSEPRPLELVEHNEEREWHSYYFGGQRTSTEQKEGTVTEMT